MMAKTSSVRVLKNTTNSCYIGAVPHDLVGVKYTFPPASAGGYTFTIAPGDIFVDEHGILTAACGGASDRYVACSNAAELDALGVEEPARIYAPKGGKRAGEVIGFHVPGAWSRIMKDVTSEYASGVSMAQRVTGAVEIKKLEDRNSALERERDAALALLAQAKAKVEAVAAPSKKG